MDNDKKEFYLIFINIKIKFMNIAGKIFLNGIVFMLLISCNSKNKINNDQSNNSANKKVENIVNMNIQIEGMTCEIGCARLIQSKLYKMEGVKFAKISFENSNGDITFDRNKISEIELKNRIQKIAGGDIYKVIAMKEVEKFTNNKEVIH